MCQKYVQIPPKCSGSNGYNSAVWSSKWAVLKSDFRNLGQNLRCRPGGWTQNGARCSPGSLYPLVAEQHQCSRLLLPSADALPVWIRVSPAAVSRPCCLLVGAEKVRAPYTVKKQVVWQPVTFKYTNLLIYSSWFNLLIKCATGLNNNKQVGQESTWWENDPNHKKTAPCGGNKGFGGANRNEERGKSQLKLKKLVL